VYSVYYGTEQAFSGGNDPTNRESLYPNFNRNAPLYQFIQKAISVRRQSNISLEHQLEVLVTDSVYAFSRGPVLVIVTNRAAQNTVHLPVSPFSVGDNVCDVMQEQPACTAVSSSGYSVTLSGEPKVMMRSPKA
jgi:glycosidase